jgi:hypothetical protein
VAEKALVFFVFSARPRGRRLATLARQELQAYAPAMLATVGAKLDRRLTTVIVTRIRREYPLLRFVPAVLIGPMVAPAATRVRRALVRATLLATTIAIFVVAVISAG